MRHSFVLLLYPMAIPTLFISSYLFIRLAYSRFIIDNIKFFFFAWHQPNGIITILKLWHHKDKISP